MLEVAMSRARILVVVVAVLALFSTRGLNADVRSDERTKFQFAGALGRVVNFFGGRAAREGVTSTVAVKGNRKLTLNDTTGQIIDLAEDKIYDLDVKKKQYRVMTFADIRRQMDEARRRAEEEARREQPATPSEPQAEPATDPNAKQFEVDFDVKNTGEKKDVNGFSTSQAVMTITVREKGKTLQDSGGLVLTSDMWLTPSIPAMKEVVDFDMKYAQKLYGPMMAGASAQEMASAMAMYPMMKPAIEKMAAEAQKLEGTAILTTTTIDAVKSAEQVAAEQSGSGSSSSASAPPTSVGGLLGGLGRRVARRNNNEQAAAGPKDRATIATTTVEVLRVSTTVADQDVAIPAGYKESR
jgi:hypothetical protein